MHDGSLSEAGKSQKHSLRTGCMNSCLYEVM